MTDTLPQNTIQYCPKCGSDAFLYRDDQSFLCRACQFHLYINAAAAVAALIVNEKGEILFTKRAIEPHKDMLDLPGGFVDILESGESALIREVKEELNLDIETYHYLMSSPNEYIFGGLSVFTLDLAYICQLNSFNHIHAKDDISDYEFITPDKIPYNRIGGESIKRITKAFAKFLINDDKKNHS